MSAARDLPDTFAAPPQPSPRSDVEIYRMWEIYKAVKAGGEVVNLLVGETTLPPTPKVVAAASRALNDGLTIGYTDALGMSSLREGIAQPYRRRHGLPIPAARLTSPVGASPGILLA